VRLRRRIITAPIPLGPIIRTEAPYPGHVDLLLCCDRGAHIFPLGLPSPDATYPVSATTQLMCRTEHARSADIARALLPDGRLSESAHMDRHRGLMHP
jgi:hypothetical protein